MRLYHEFRTEPGQAGAEALGPADSGQEGRRPEQAAIRVLHVAQSIAGGVASYFEEVAAYQNDAFGKSNVTFLIPSGSEAHLPTIDPAQVLTFPRVTRRPGALLDFGRSARRAVRLLNPDVVHLHSSFAGAVVRTSIRPQERRPRVIYSPHGWAFGMEVAQIRKLAYAAVERQLAARTDLILVSSRSEHSLAMRFGLPAQKMKLVRNGIAWKPPSARSPGEHGIRLAFIGRHDRQKGLDVLLDAIARFSIANIEFHIVGDNIVGPRSGRDRKPPSNVSLHGWLSRIDMQRLLQQMDAVIMPSRWEAFGLVAAEAMRAGVPVIGSNRGALPEVIGDGVGGYIFDIDDPDGLGRLLQRLDQAELRRLGQSARTRWEREFVADGMNRLIHDAYEFVLDSQVSRRGHG